MKPYLDIMRPQDFTVGRSLIKPGMKTTLKEFISKTNNVNDRQKALKILESIDNYDKTLGNSNNLVKEYKLKSAFRTPKVLRSDLKNEIRFNGFTTAYHEDYPIKLMKETVVIRPPSTKDILVNQSKTVNKDADSRTFINNDLEFDQSRSIYDPHSTYNHDYCTRDKYNGSNWKYLPPDRSGTASGNRCNNPHPSKEFMVWRFAREPNSKESKIPSSAALKANIENNFAQITDEQLNCVMQGNCRSTYQSDFVGGSIPECQITPFCLRPEIKTPPKLKNSTQRTDFSRPVSAPMEIKVHHDRYGCNKTVKKAALGIIPDATSEVYKKTFSRTTYDDEVNNRAKIICDEIIKDGQTKDDLIKLQKLKYFEKAASEPRNETDKESLRYQNLNYLQDFKRKSFVRKLNYKTEYPKWISTYPGPL